MQLQHWIQDTAQTSKNEAAGSRCCILPRQLMHRGSRKSRHSVLRLLGSNIQLYAVNILTTKLQQILRCPLPSLQKLYHHTLNNPNRKYEQGKLDLVTHWWVLVALRGSIGFGIFYYKYFLLEPKDTEYSLELESIALLSEIVKVRVTPARPLCSAEPGIFNRNNMNRGALYLHPASHLFPCKEKRFETFRPGLSPPKWVLCWAGCPGSFIQLYLTILKERGSLRQTFTNAFMTKAVKERVSVLHKSLSPVFLTYCSLV